LGAHTVALELTTSRTTAAARGVCAPKAATGAAAAAAGGAAAFFSREAPLGMRNGQVETGSEWCKIFLDFSFRKFLCKKPVAIALGSRKFLQKEKCC